MNARDDFLVAEMTCGNGSSRLLGKKRLKDRGNGYNYGKVKHQGADAYLIRFQAAEASG